MSSTQIRKLILGGKVRGSGSWCMHAGLCWSGDVYCESRKFGSH